MLEEERVCMPELSNFHLTRLLALRILTANPGQAERLSSQQSETSSIPAFPKLELVMEGQHNTNTFADAEAYSYDVDNTSSRETQRAQCKAATLNYAPVVDALELHPFADIFPLLKGNELDRMVADIKRNGLREPIIRTPDGRILDGRNRYLACRALKLEPWFETTEELPEKWLSFVFSNPS